MTFIFHFFFLPLCLHCQAQAPVALAGHVGAAWQVDIPVGHDDSHAPFEWAAPLPFLLSSESLGATLALCSPDFSAQIIFHSELGG